MHVAVAHVLINPLRVVMELIGRFTDGREGELFEQVATERGRV